MLKPKSIYSFPNFICLGAQKCATTWVYKNLNKHPNVVMPSIKELRYFDPWHGQDWEEYQNNFLTPKTEAQYRNIFEKYNNGIECIITGDMTPDYLIGKNAPSQIKSKLPYVKLFVILRNPTQRAFSQYGMMTRSKVRTSFLPPFIECFKNDLEHMSLRGFYADQLANFLLHFELDRNLKVFFYDDLLNNGQEDFFDSICDYLEIGPINKPLIDRELKHTNIGKIINPEDEIYINEFYAKANSKLYSLLGRDLNWS